MTASAAADEIDSCTSVIASTVLRFIELLEMADESTVTLRTVLLLRNKATLEHVGTLCEMSQIVRKRYLFFLHAPLVTRSRKDREQLRLAGVFFAVYSSIQDHVGSLDLKKKHNHRRTINSNLALGPGNELKDMLTIGCPKLFLSFSAYAMVAMKVRNCINGSTER